MQEIIINFRVVFNSVSKVSHFMIALILHC